MRKTIERSLAIGLSIIISLNLGIMNASAFTDVDDSEMYAKGIEYLTSQGIVNGNPDGTYAPEKTLNRAELLKIIAESKVKINGGGDDVFFDDYKERKCFNDVGVKEWYTGYVCFAKEQGWVKGYEGNKFKPTQQVTFAEGLKITAKAFGLQYDESADPWYKDLVTVASDNYFIPQTITGFNNGFRRDEMADMTTRFIKRVESEDALIKYIGVWADTKVTYETIEAGKDLSMSPDTSSGPYMSPKDDNSGISPLAPGINTGEDVEANTPITINASLFSSDASYTGPFPAPEGIALYGKYGQNKYKDPTGTSAFRYRTQIAWQRDIQCIDGNRTVTNSLGLTWEKGFFYGRSVADAELKHVEPVFDDTPKGEGSGTKLYDEGYRGGYGYRWQGGTDGRFSCPPRDGSTDMSLYDNDGWLVLSDHTKLPGIETLWVPPTLSLGKSSQSVLGSESLSIALDGHEKEVEESSFNSKKAPINISRIDMVESAGTADLDLEKDLLDFYKEIRAESQKKYGNTVAFLSGDTPTIETKTYGKNVFTQLSYAVANNGKWNLTAYAQRKDPKTNKVTTIFIYDSKDVSNSTKDGFDLTKTPNVDFLAEFFTKIEFTNY